MYDRGNNMKTKILFSLVSIFILSIFSGCYTQIMWRDTGGDYEYRTKVKKKVQIEEEEKYVEEDTTYVEEDTSYIYDEEEAGYYEDEDYYYPSHRRGFKYYYPSISIVFGSTYFYDPWYFSNWYFPWDWCRVYYPGYWWYWPWYSWGGWYYSPSYFYYDPWYNYWTWNWGYWNYPVYKYRKNDFTRLRDNDGGRGRIVSGGNLGRDLKLRTRDINDRRIDSGREHPGVRDRNIRIDDRMPTRTLEREKKILERDKTDKPTRSKDVTIERTKRIDDRKPPTGLRDKNQRNIKDKTIERKTDEKNIRKNDSETKKRIEKREIPKINYQPPRREYTPPKREEPRKEYTPPKRNDQPTRESNPPRYEPPRREYSPPPQRSTPPSYNPPPRQSPSPSQGNSSSTRRRD